MKLVEINWKPTDRQLRQFGIISLVALPLVTWLWSGDNLRLIGIFACVGLAAAFVGWLAPQSLRPVFLLLMIVAAPIGIVVGELATLFIFYGVFLPISIMFRLISRDRLQRGLDRGAATYWQTKPSPASAASYYRQS